MKDLLMIPGPVELSPQVVEALSLPIASHVSPTVIEAHSCVLDNMRKVWLAGDNTQPFVIAGSGTIAMEMALLNTCQPNDRVIVMNSGYFGDRMEKMLRRLGVHVVSIKAEKIGAHPRLEGLETTLSSGEFKAVFGTHVDTSTGVRLDVESVAKLATKYNALSIFDGVCATAGEVFRMKDWGADVYYTASQKAIGLPPGLALMVVSEAAMKARKTMSYDPPLSLDWLEWLPIMEAYENRKKSYFSTPATSLILALDVSLKEILSLGMEEVFLAHEKAAQDFRAIFKEAGLSLVPESGLAANTLSAVYFGNYPEMISLLKKEGIIIAGGLHPKIKGEYFRIGHMGYSVRSGDHLESCFNALNRVLKKE